MECVKFYITNISDKEWYLNSKSFQGIFLKILHEEYIHINLPQKRMHKENYSIAFLL